MSVSPERQWLKKCRQQREIRQAKTCFPPSRTRPKSHHTRNVAVVKLQHMNIAEDVKRLWKMGLQDRAMLSARLMSEAGYSRGSIDSVVRTLLRSGAIVRED